MEGLDLVMVAALCVLILIGFPVAFTLAGTALLFAGLGIMLGRFDSAFLGFFPNRIYGLMTNEVLMAVPLFVFMGVMLERSRVAEALIVNVSHLFRRRHGGLGLAVMIVGALLAASTGIIGATVVAIGLLALPTMLKHGYDATLATGTIAAAGTLGQIIPPSIVLVILGDQIALAHQEAARRNGQWAVDPVSVGDLFAGALLPGLFLVGLYLAYLLINARMFPEGAPPVRDERIARSHGDLVHAMVAPLVLIFAVLGTILGGIATPTEAAGVGALGAVLLSGYRFQHIRRFWIDASVLSLLVLIALVQLADLRLGRDQIAIGDRLAIIMAFVLCALIVLSIATVLHRAYYQGVLADVMQRTTRISAMVFMIVIGAQLFSLVFRGFDGDARVQDILIDLPGGPQSAMFLVMGLIFVLGFFLDFIEITFLVVPIVCPVLLQLGFDPVWLGVMIALNLQTSFLTPPFGLAHFYLRGVAPQEIGTLEIYKGIIPFVVLQLITLISLSLMPSMATWLPSVLAR